MQNVGFLMMRLILCSCFMLTQSLELFNLYCDIAECSPWALVVVCQLLLSKVWPELVMGKPSLYQIKTGFSLRYIIQLLTIEALDMM